MTAIHNPENAPLIEIYALIDPRDAAIRYVGKANNAQARLRSHIRDSSQRHTPGYIWIGELLSLGLRPNVAVLRRVSAEQWEAAEREEIAARAGLLNVARGGNQPECDIETRRANARKVTAMREADPKRKRLQYLRMQITRALRNGYVRSDSTKAKLRALIDRWPERYGEWAALLK